MEELLPYVVKRKEVFENVSLLLHYDRNIAKNCLYCSDA